MREFEALHSPQVREKFGDGFFSQNFEPHPALLPKLAIGSNWRILAVTPSQNITSRCLRGEIADTSRSHDTAFVLESHLRGEMNQ